MPLHHATLIVVRDRGLLIAGPSGSGKTTLAAVLLGEALARGWFARLVADDQVLLQSHLASPRLIGSVPPTIAGLWEVPPLGPKATLHEAHAIVDLVITLRAPQDLPRMVEPEIKRLCGVPVAHVDLPRQQAAILVPALHALLFDEEGA
ncbi:MAG TPA: HPr kinase/phosphorylase [Tianweitania sediminis]|jgi:serine kinase of HPr protein (carbohydrate metabolism regulator)|nr:HPr kinase/phosphorylase [Tianweitania sediminis]